MNFRRLLTNQLFIILSTLIPIIVFGFLTYQNLKTENETTSHAYIERLNTNVNHEILAYFKSVSFHLHNLTHTVSFLEKQVEKNIANLQSLQKKHIVDYFQTLDETLLTLSQKDIFQYVYSFKKRAKTVLPQYTESLQKYVQILNTPNVLMLTPQGDILYSANKKELLYKNVQNITPAFNAMWQQIKNLKHNNDILYVQIAYDKYTDKYEQYAITHFKDVDGYIAIEVHIKHIEKDLANVSSLGSSAETYLAYKEQEINRLVYTRHLKHMPQGAQTKSPFVALGFQESGFNTQKGENGDIELVGYTPLHIHNITYSMQTTLSYIDIISPQIHEQNFFEHFIQGYGYTNLFLVANSGDIFYSAKKDDDYHGNIFTPPYENSLLTKAIKEVLKTKKFILIDKEKSATCTDAKQSQFAILPLHLNQLSMQTILVVKLDDTKLQNYLATDTSIYKNTHSYILPQKSSLTPHPDLLIQGSDIDYSQIHWKLVTEISQAEILENLNSLKLNIYLFLIVSIFIAIISMYIITNEKIKHEKKLTHEVMHDHLTKLPNRKYVTEFLENILIRSKRNSRKVAVLFLDLDKFKIINDTYGHKVGDRVLIEIAERLKNVVRESDLVARIGGDEFLIIVNEYKHLHDLDNVCKKLLQSVARDITDENNTYRVGLSIGIATYPSDSTKASELLTYADTAMYATKESGRHNFTYYNQEMMQASLHEAQLLEELTQAIQKNEFILYYQPQVHLQKQAVIGVEALIRWEHPVRGFIMPNDFIPIAENSHLIVDLGYWVLRQACQDFKTWQTQGYTMEYVAVNMSTKQLSSHNCVANVMAILKELDFNPQNLELEITETTLIADFETTIDNINTFKSYGIKFSIDDFGTGYSSLSYLKTLHISTLKIDRVFVKEILTDRDDRTIVTAIIAMGHALDYSIIAEGAETKAEIELLKYLSCDTIQGYYFSKPLPAQKLLEFIDKGIS